ncbi:MAG: hypothetical protein LQ351_002075 [Letrouitia transgressa]|nr:MAG: hypothetical protein LQ351_002075 [Letrouitia transgressa]
MCRDAENLQFYLWFQDYQRRFYALPQTQQNISPPWNEETLPQAGGPLAADPGPRLSDKTLDQAVKYKISFEKNDSPESLIDRKSAVADPVDQAYAQSGLKWKSFTIQPFRDEIDKIISHYLVPGSPRELNLSHKDRSACLHALQHTTHPSALTVPSSIVTETLRSHSHPNFIRWSMANGNTPRIIFGRVLGTLNIIFGFLISFFLLFSPKPRWWRIFAALAWFLGFAFLLAGSNGICLVLYVTKDRHLRPWEQFSSSELSLPSSKSGRSKKYYGLDEESDQYTLGGSDTYSMSLDSKNSLRKTGGRFAVEAFGTANNYGHEVWVEKYRAKMMIRKIFDTRVWVQNEHLRIMQDKVSLQSVLWSLIVTIPLTILFTALPRGHGY